MSESLRVGSNELKAALDLGRQYLQSTQTKNGNFSGLSGAYSPQQLFNPTRPSPTIFFTSLVLNCLAGVPSSRVISRRAVSFLLSQRGDNWRWNYWIRGSDMQKSHPYPDDLDDIACAYAALYSYDPSLIDGSAMGHLAQTLISAEVQPGGPYYTWLDAKWKTIDVAVNANIGYMLSQHTVTLPGLDDYVTEMVNADKYESEFYVGCIPSLYFISRWYNGSRQALLRQRIIDEIDIMNGTTTSPNALLISLLISSGCRSSVPPEFLYPLMKQQITLQKHGHWAAEALYRDPHIDGVDLYAGSAALTTAFALEAIQNYQVYSRKNGTALSKTIGPKTQKPLKSEKSLLVSSYRQYKQKFLRSNGIPEITNIANITAEAYGKALPQAIIDYLNAASIDGWISYSIYDNFLDDAAKPELLGVANYAQRQMLLSFSQAIPDESFAHFVYDTLAIMDEANTWEVLHAHAKRVKNKLQINAMPNYVELTHLAHKSLGHLLASTGVLASLGYAVDSNEVKLFQKFFFHFLIARQLSDDAHDWEEDIQAGHLTPVICILLGSLPATITPKQIEKLRLRFWQTTILDVSKLIHDHTSLARKALSACTFFESTSVFNGWLTNLDNGASQAETGSQETKKFIAAFGGMADTVET